MSWGGWEQQQWQQPQGQQQQWGQQAQQQQWPQQQQQQARPATMIVPAAGGQQSGQARQPVVISGAARQGGQVTAAGKGGTAAASGTYTVTASAADAQEVVIKTLLGEFVVSGDNHDRKIYKKSPDPTSNMQVDVFMYYWDGRDGPAFQGWWFGNQVGGSQVWSHNGSEAQTPPLNGWKIPWDGDVRPSLQVTPKGGGAAGGGTGTINVAATGGATGGWGAAAGGGAAGGVQQAASHAMTNAKTTIQQAHSYMVDTSNAEFMKEGLKMLVPLAQPLAESLRKCVDAQRGATGRGEMTGQLAQQYSQLANQLRQVQSSVNSEMAKARTNIANADKAGKNKEAEAKETLILEEVMPEARQKTNLAEDCVEKAVITSEMIAAAAEDFESAKQAVQETESAVTEAQKSLGEARIFVNAKQASMRRLECESIKTKANAEMAKLQQQLQQAQVKLNPLKTARQDFLARAAARKLTADVLERLTPAEVDADRADESSMMLESAGDTPPKDMVDEADKTLTKALDSINAAIKYIDAKKSGASSAITKAELESLDERARGTLAKLTSIKNKQKELGESAVVDSISKEAGDKLTVVMESVKKAVDAEGPFLIGVEELPPGDTMAAVKAIETASTSANTAVSIARMYIATKLVETKRMTPGPAELGQKKLKECQVELDKHAKKLTELKANTANRKKKAFMHEAECEVAKAEGLAKDVAEAVLPFKDSEKLFELSSAEIGAAAEATLKAVEIANKAMVDARKFITAQQIQVSHAEAEALRKMDAQLLQERMAKLSPEMRVKHEAGMRLASAKAKSAAGAAGSSDATTDLAKFQSRLSQAQTEVGKYKKLVASVDERLATKKVLEEASSRLDNAEERLKKLNDAFEKAQSAPKETEDGKAKEGDPVWKEVDGVVAEASNGLKAAQRYLEVQGRAGGAIKSELDKLQPKAAELQEKLEAIKASIQERTDRLQIDVIRADGQGKVEVAEKTLEDLKQAEAPFIMGNEDMPGEELTSALRKLDEASSAAAKACNDAKTTLAMKRLAAKRMGESLKAQLLEDLSTMQTTLDALTKDLTTIKKGMTDRKASTTKKEVVAVVADVGKKVQISEEATAVLTAAEETTTEKMKEGCQAAGTAQAAVQQALLDAVELLNTRQRDAKNISGADAEIVKEITELLEKLTEMQATVDTQKGVLREREHQFVAERLTKDAATLMEKAESQKVTTEKIAAPMMSDHLEEFTRVVFLQHIVDMIREYGKTVKKEPKELFEEVAEKKASMTEVQLTTFIARLLGLPENKELFFSDEQQKAAFKLMLKGDATEATEADFLEQFRSRYMVLTLVTMTDSLNIKGGKSVRKLVAGELVEALDEPSKDENVGIPRIKAKSEKDGAEGYISMTGNQGSVYLEPYSAIVAAENNIHKSIAEFADATKAALAYLDTKVKELKAVKAGPLAETKSALQMMRPKVLDLQQTADSFRDKVSSAKQKLTKTMEEEKMKRQDAIDKKEATATLDEVNEAVKLLTEEVDKLLPVAEGLSKTAGADTEDPLKAMDESLDNLQAVSGKVETELGSIKAKIDMVKGGTKGPLGEMRQALLKKKVTVGAIEMKCKKQVNALRNAKKQVANTAHDAFVAALQAHMRSSGKSADALFKEVAKDEPKITAGSLKELLSKAELKAGQLDLALERYTDGLAKLTMLEILQDFQRCIKEIALTTAAEVKSSKTIRKAMIGEIFEMLEPPVTDAALSMTRQKCRSLKDGAEGYITLKGNQGTSFLEKTSKPYYVCEFDIPLTSEFDSSSSSTKPMKRGEVFELLEGPKKEAPTEAKRVRGKAQKDGKSGWVTLTDALEPVKKLVCRQAIAMTSEFDIGDKEGKTIKKLSIGEALEKLDPEERVDEVRQLTRIRVKVGEDEGWVTIRGNQGTAYAELDEKLNEVKMPIALETRLSAGSPAIRMMDVGEFFEITDGPKTEKVEGVERVKGRSLGDGSEGWFTVGTPSTQPWSPLYKCSVATELHDGASVEQSKELRKLEVGESLCALGTPILVEADGILRLNVRADKDGLVGFATLKGKEGPAFLVDGSTPDEEPERVPVQRPAGSRADRSDRAGERPERAERPVHRPDSRPERAAPPRPTRGGRR